MRFWLGGYTEDMGGHAGGIGVLVAGEPAAQTPRGALTFGGVDESLYEGSITYTPVTATYPAGYYWGINVTGATYGDETVIPGSYAGIVDTGTTREYDGAGTRP